MYTNLVVYLILWEINSASYSKYCGFGLLETKLVAVLCWFLGLGSVVVKAFFLLFFNFLESHAKEAYWTLFDSFLLSAPLLTALDHAGLSMYECKARASAEP